MAAKPVYDRLATRSVTAQHKFNIASWLHKSYGGSEFSGSRYEEQKLARHIIDNYSRAQIEYAHAQLVNEYASSGGRAFSKGRNPGSRNRYQRSDKGIERGPHNINVADDLLEDDIIAQNLEEPAATININGLAPAQQFSKSDLFDVLRNYALRTELKDATSALEHALRDYCENNFANVNQKIDAIELHRPTIIELKRQDLPNIELGVQHRNFPKLVHAANSLSRGGNHLNVWLYGPAGSGKTTAAEKLAELFGLEYRYNGALTSAFQLLGYNDAQGRYVSTAFRQAWEFGGVYLFDEIDGSMPDALLAMNGALANSIASFPDKMVRRHKDCIIIAGANTTGLGGGAEYVGAMKQNAAFLNRFVFISWPHDDALEDALCANKAWLARVRVVREKFSKQGNKGHLITMRASLFGEALLAGGMDWQDVEHATLKQGMSDAQWQAIK